MNTSFQNNTLVKTTCPDKHIALISMQDKEGKNSLSPLFVDALICDIKRVSKDQDIKVVVLKGLPSVFCSGADLNTLKQLAAGKIKPVDLVLSKMMLDIPVPVIAAMEGHAVGGGLALGLCADIVVMAEESRYGCSFMNMGFTPGMGITKLMEHYMTPAIAHEMQYTGSFKKGKELVGKTHFNHIVPKRDVLPLAEQLAEAIAEKPIHALRTLKRCLAMPRRKLFEETHSMESMMHELTFNQKDILKNIRENYVS